MLSVRNRSRSRSRGRAPVRVSVPRVARSASLRRSMSRSRSRSSVRSVVPRGIATDHRNVHSFRRWCTAENIDLTGVAYTAGMEFKLSDLPGNLEFGDLYDRYKLTTVVLRFRIVNNPYATWATNSGAATANSTNWFPRLFYCRDYDDSSAESLSALRERSKTKMTVLRPNKFFKIVVKPAVTIQTYRTTTTTGYSPSWNQWIDMAQNNVPYYGLKYVVDMSGLDPADSQPFKLEIEKQYFFTCKDVR